MISVFWSGHGRVNNFGDIINPYLVEKISGEQVQFSRSPSEANPVYLVAGSILGVNLGENKKHCIVWGSGFIGPRTIIKPKKICAVRGPLTRNVLLEQGIDCPEVYGDPVLLLPRYHKPKSVPRTHTIGVVPHYIDQKSSWTLKWQNDEDIKIINILDPVEKVIDDIYSCKIVASSSLHGLIVADAYSIPSLWVEFSDGVVGSGFKFRDYLLSVGAEAYEPMQLRDPDIEPIRIIYNQWLVEYEPRINLDMLYDACPFRKDRK